MRLREETKIREKMTVQLETRHVLAILALSILFSGLVFGFGLFVGKRGQGGMTTLQPTVLKAQKSGGEAQRKGELVVPLFARLPEEVSSRFSPSEMVGSLGRFWVESHLDTLAKDQAANAVEEELLRAKVRHRIQPDLYAAPKQSDAQKDVPIDVGEERLAPDHSMKDGNELPQGAPLPPLEARPKAAPKSLAKEEAVAEMQVKAEEAPALAAARPGVPKPKGERVLKEAIAEEERSGVSAEKPVDNPIRVYSVQLLAYRDRTSALDYVRRLGSSPLCAKHKPFIMPVEVPEKGQFYRVRIGRFTSKKEAERVRSKASSQEGIDAKVVSM